MKKNLTKEVRLTKQTFKLTLQRGIRVKLPNMKVFCHKNTLDGVRYAVGVGKKYGNAVERNRAKRLLREAWRLVRADVTSGYDLVVIVYNKDITLTSCYNQLRQLLQRLGIINTSQDEDLKDTTTYSLSNE